MTDFKQAFLQGQDAVDRARSAKKEISETFARLFEAVADVTHGTVEMRLKTYPKGGAYSSAFMALTLATSKFIRDAEAIPTDEWIIARNTKSTDAAEVKLARWKQSDAGYPCTIRYSEVDEQIRHQSQLETALASFLANPWVGERIQKLSKAHEKEVTEPPKPTP